MPRRSGWFLVAEGEHGNLAHPVDSRAQVCTVLARLVPVVPLSATWYMEWRSG